MVETPEVPLFVFNQSSSLMSDRATQAMEKALRNLANPMYVRLFLQDFILRIRVSSLCGECVAVTSFVDAEESVFAFSFWQIFSFLANGMILCLCIYFYLANKSSL